MTAWFLLGMLPAAAAGSPLQASGELEFIDLAVLPYDHPLLPDEPSARALLLQRSGLLLAPPGPLRLEAQHLLVADARAGDFPDFGGLWSLGSTAGGTPEAVDLSWTAETGDALAVEGRVDRLLATLRLGSLDLRLGRQALSFGHAWFFTPLDLVAPFTPTTLDREYKPGVDAARLDAYLGTAGRLTAVAAYAGDWSLDGSVLALHAGTTLGLTDLGLLAASARGDRVLGLEAAGSLGAWGWYAEATGTLPAQDDAEAFARGVLGASRHLDGPGLDLLGELYGQSCGADGPGDYLAFADDSRVQRGELWTLGHLYAALSASWAVEPVLSLQLAAVANLQDPSALLGPGLSYSPSDEAELAAGAFLGLGERPPEWSPEQLAGALQGEPLPLGSELGTIPSLFFVQLREYF